MNTPTNAYLTKFSSGTILTLLALSGFLFLVPLAAPVNAAQNAALPTLTATPNAVVATTATLWTLKVANPSTNAYAITAITVTAPSGWSFATPSCTGTFLTTLAASSGSAFQCTGSGATVLPPGFSTVLGTSLLSTTTTLTGPAAPASSPAVTGVFTTSIADAGSSPAAYAGPSFTEYSIASITSAGVVVTLSPTNTQFVAGGSAYTVTVTLSTGQAGVPIVWSFPSTYPQTTGFTASLTPTSGSTGSTGVTTTTFTPSNAVTDNAAITATIGTSTISGASGIVTTNAAAPSKITFSLSGAKFPTTHYLSGPATTVCNTAPAVTFTGATQAGGVGSLVTYAISDTFGNAVPAATIAITAGPGSVLVAATPTSGSALFDTGAATTCATSVAIAAVSGPMPLSYFQTGTYGITGKLTMALTGTYTPPGGTGTGFSISGFTGNLVSGTFAAISPTPTVDGSSLTGLTIPAGKSFRVRTIVSPVQSGVPITVYALPGTVGGTQTGTFGTGLKSIALFTNSSGIAAATFTADTLATDTVKFNSTVTKPTDASPSATLAFSSPSSTITTVAGTATTFVVKMFFDTTLASAVAVKSSTVAGVTYYLNIALSDAYGNSVTVAGVSQLQITLSSSPSTAVVLSATSVYIPSGCASTANAPLVAGCTTSFGPITATLPSTLALGTSITLTASGAVGGTAVLGAKTFSTVSPLPTLLVKSPVSAGGALFSNTQTLVFSGGANASVGYPSSITIFRVGFKIGTAAWQSAAIAPANKVLWSVAASFPVGLNTVQFNATDSSSPANVFVGAPTSVLVDTSPPTVAFTTAAGATLTAGAPLVATITDTLGDLNATAKALAAMATRNGTAIAASSITVTGTNTLGSSVTYTVSITGLPSGKWTVALTAFDLAGNKATVVSITVTVVVLTNQTFTIPAGSPPVQSTQSGFTGVSVTWTNNAATSQTANLWFVAYNAKNQVVFASFTQLTFGAGASASLFQGLSSTLLSGTYTVQVFVVSTTGTALSASTPVTVSF